MRITRTQRWRGLPLCTAPLGAWTTGGQGAAAYQVTAITANFISVSRQLSDAWRASCVRLYWKVVTYTE